MFGDGSGISTRASHGWSGGSCQTWSPMNYCSRLSRSVSWIGSARSLPSSTVRSIAGPSILILPLLRAKFNGVGMSRACCIRQTGITVTSVHTTVHSRCSHAGCGRISRSAAWKWMLRQMRANLCRDAHTSSWTLPLAVPALAEFVEDWGNFRSFNLISFSPPHLATDEQSDTPLASSAQYPAARHSASMDSDMEP